MTAKMDLLAKLTALMPECAGEIAKILHDYEIMPSQDAGGLPRAAQGAHRQVQEACAEDHDG